MIWFLGMFYAVGTVIAVRKVYLTVHDADDSRAVDMAVADFTVSAIIALFWPMLVILYPLYRWVTGR